MLNYYPNQVAQQLKTGQARMIGLPVPSIVNPSFSALACEADLVAKKRQLRVLIGNDDGKENTFPVVEIGLGHARAGDRHPGLLIDGGTRFFVMTVLQFRYPDW